MLIKEAISTYASKVFVAAGVAVMGFFGSAIYNHTSNLLTMESRIIETIERTNNRLDILDKRFVILRDDIEAIRRPSEIFDIAASSAPVDGYCVEGKPCTIRVTARRTAEGLSCEIIPDATEYYFTNPRTQERRRVLRINHDKEKTINLGLDWTDLMMTVETPVDFEGQSAYFFIPFYTKCNGPHDDVTVSQESKYIPVEIRKE